MFDLIQLGIYFEELIKTAVGFLDNYGWAGLICWRLLLSLIVLSAWYIIFQQRVSNVLSAAVDLHLTACSREEFSSKLEIRQSHNDFAKSFG